MTHRDPQGDFFIFNEFRAEVRCRKERGKVQSFKGLKAQEMDTNVWSSLWPEGLIVYHGTVCYNFINYFLQFGIFLTSIDLHNIHTYLFKW